MSQAAEHIKISEHLTKFAEKNKSRTPVLHYIYCNKSKERPAIFFSLHKKGESNNEGPWLNWDWKMDFIKEMVKKISDAKTENFHPANRDFRVSDEVASW